MTNDREIAMMTVFGIVENVENVENGTNEALELIWGAINGTEA